MVESAGELNSEFTGYKSVLQANKSISQERHRSFRSALHRSALHRSALHRSAFQLVTPFVILLFASAPLLNADAIDYKIDENKLNAVQEHRRSKQSSADEEMNRWKEWQNELKQKGSQNYLPKLHACLSDSIKIYETKGEVEALAYAKRNGLEIIDNKVTVALELEFTFSAKKILKELEDFKSTVRKLQFNELGYVANIPIGSLREITEKIPKIEFIRPLLKERNGLNNCSGQVPEEISDYYYPVENRKVKYAEDSLVVYFKSSVSNFKANLIIGSYNGCITYQSHYDNLLYEIRIENDKETKIEELLSKFAHDPSVDNVTPGFLGGIIINQK